MEQEETSGFAEVRVPLGSGETVKCRLSVSYCKSDPLIVRLAILAPSDAVVLERFVLRSDFRLAMYRPIYSADVSVQPGTLNGVTLIEFREGQTCLSVIVPTEPLRTLLTAADNQVPPGTESQALDEALRELVDSRRLDRAS